MIAYIIMTLSLIVGLGDVLSLVQQIRPITDKKEQNKCLIRGIICIVISLIMALIVFN